MKHAIIRKLHIWLIVAVLLSCFLMVSLMFHMQEITDRAADELGSLYMSEMMLQTQEHFESITEIKFEEANHIAAHVKNLSGDELRTALQEAASHLGFEYLALYDKNGTYETVLGEIAWYRNIDSYISAILDGKNVATTGYLTDVSDKYIVFGVPASYKMNNQETSEIMLIGFSIAKLYEYIYVDNNPILSNDTKVWIVLTNGSYIYRYDEINETSFYDHIRHMGSFVGADTETAISEIESAISNNISFTCTVSNNNEQTHIYGAPANQTNDWYFVLTMPQGAPDSVIDNHSSSSMIAFLIAGIVVLMLFLFVFLMYMRLSMQQLTEREKARAEAENANRAKSTFLFNASHDIRTPMNAIRGFAKIIESHPDDSELVRKNIAKINQSSDTLMQLLNDVLELSRIESNKMELVPVPLDLQTQMDNMQTMFQQDMQNSGISFSVECRLTDKIVLCDSLKLTQILMNLLSNSRKFTPSGGSVVCGVEQLSADNGIGRYRFYVNDTGIGMSEEFQQKAFEQFERERTSTVSGMQGSGLGLSIIKRIVDKMEGTCSLQSKLNEGTQIDVFLNLPITELPAEASDVSQAPSIDLSGKHLLLVEDNELNREITRYMIESMNMTVDEAVNGQEALKIISECPTGKYDLVLMDIQMPIMDGFTASEHIRELDDPARASIPIIALTANAFREDRERCLNAGMNAHVCKPINPDELTAAIASIFGK